MPNIKKTVQHKMTDAKRIEFAKQLEEFYQSSHGNSKKIFGLAVLKGVGTGLGVFLGGTVVITLLLWILSQFNNVPFVKDITKATEHSINEGKE